MDKIKEGISQIDLIEELPVYTNKTAPTVSCGAPGSGRGEFDRPKGISMDTSEIWTTSQVYIVDAGNKRIQVVDSRDGSYIKEFGRGYLTNPLDITICNQCVFITDRAQHNVTKFSMDGAYVSKVGYQGTGSLQFNSPLGIASDASTLYICDFHNKRIQVLDKELKYVGTINVLFCPASIQVTAVAIHVMGQSDNTVHMYGKSTSNLIRSIQLIGQEYQIKVHSCFTVDAAGNYLVSAHYEKSIRILDSEGVLRHTLGHIELPMGILVLSNNTIICVDNGRGYKFHIY